jgi:hypothetical protein
MHGLTQDLRYAFRRLYKAPGFAFTAVFTLALGMGATTLVCSVIRAVLLNSLPFPKPLEGGKGAAGRLSYLSHSMILPAALSAKFPSFRYFAYNSYWPKLCREMVHMYEVISENRATLPLRR